MPQINQLQHNVTQIQLNTNYPIITTVEQLRVDSEGKIRCEK